MRKRSLTRQVGVVMSEETYDLLIKITDQKEVPVSVFVRQLIEDHFTKTFSDTGKGKPNSGSGIQKSKVNTTHITI